MFVQEYKFISSQNKFIYALLILNALFIIIILYLLLSNGEPASIGKGPDSAKQTLENAASSINAENVLAATKQTKVSTMPVKPKTATELTPEKPAASSEANISGIHKELTEIVRTITTPSPDSNDTAYVNALQQLKHDKGSRVTASKPTIQVPAAYSTSQGKTENKVDYFNKVDVGNNISESSEKKQSLAQQIANVVSEPEETVTIDESTPDVQNDSYIEELKTESIERANEMRTIQVVQGDTLWDIAVRAYGSGSSYPKIYQANPHLTSPDKIEVGDYLRVPL